MLNEDELKALEDNEITIDSESPLELSMEDGSVATGIFAHWIIKFLIYW